MKYNRQCVYQVRYDHSVILSMFVKHTYIYTSVEFIKKV